MSSQTRERLIRKHIADGCTDAECAKLTSAPIPLIHAIRESMRMQTPGMEPDPGPEF